jgi:hypothetical protein
VEWLEDKLNTAHKKWDQIYQEIDSRALQATQDRTPGDCDDYEETRFPDIPTAHEHIFSTGGILEKLIRKNYYAGLNKFNNNSFPNKEACREWLKWVEDLTDKEMAIVKSEDWE